MTEGSIVWVADFGDWGFFTGDPLPNIAPLSVNGLPENVRQDFEFVHVEGLATPMQFCRVSLTPAAGETPTHVVVVSAYPPVPPERVPDATRRLLPVCSSASLCLVVEDRAGWARATSIANGSPQAVAAAVAYSKIVGGWDESDAIVVIVDGDAFKVSGHFRDDRWELTAAHAG